MTYIRDLTVQTIWHCIVSVTEWSHLTWNEAMSWVSSQVETFHCNTDTLVPTQGVSNCSIHSQMSYYAAHLRVQHPFPNEILCNSSESAASIPKWDITQLIWECSIHSQMRYYAAHLRVQHPFSNELLCSSSESAASIPKWDITQLIWECSIHSQMSYYVAHLRVQHPFPNEILRSSSESAASILKWVIM